MVWPGDVVRARTVLIVVYPYASLLAGAYHGLEGIPAEWVEVLESTEKGRDYVLYLAARLHDRYVELLA